MSKADVPTVVYTVRGDLFVRGAAATVYCHTFGTKQFGKCSVRLKDGYWIIIEGDAVTIVPEGEIIQIFVERHERHD